MRSSVAVLVALLLLELRGAVPSPPRSPTHSTDVGAEKPCEGIFFVYFQDDQKIRFALSRDGFHWTALYNNAPIPGLDGDNTTSVRDPFVNFDPVSGIYRMVATDGFKFGHDAQIWYWESSDLLSWSKQRALPVMDKFKDSLQDTWAPEWVWDAAASEYVIFWTTRWLPGKEIFDPACTNKNVRRFVQYHTRTKDWRSFTPPSLLIDMHCSTDAFAPMAVGDGGYDTDIVRSPADGKYYAFFKDMRAPTAKIGGKPWNDKTVQPWSGVHVCSSSDLRNWSAPLPHTQGPKGLDPAFIGMWGAEGPEVLVVNGTTMHLYFDCSFEPTPTGYERPPYGMATAPYPQGFTEPGSSWKPVKGSCTGNSTGAGGVSFPRNASQGSFVCVSNAQYAAIAAKWGLSTAGASGSR